MVDVPVYRAKGISTAAFAFVPEDRQEQLDRHCDERALDVRVITLRSRGATHIAHRHGTDHVVTGVMTAGICMAYSRLS